MVYRHNSYVTRKIPYKRILNGIRMVKLFKQLLSLVYRGKEMIALLAKIKKISLQD